MSTPRKPVGFRAGRRLAALAGAVVAAAILVGCSATPTPSAGQAERPKPTASSTPHAVAAVSAVEPATGSVSGGTTASVTGSGLDAVTSVTVGGVAATDVTVANGSSVSFVVPAALHFQPAAAEVVVLEGETPIGAPLPFAYTVVTGLDAQMQYALTHWNNYNVAEWGNLNSVGGDCANFVSQTLIKRGWAQNATWYNKNAAASWSPAWGYAPAMNNWFAGDKSLGLTKLTLDQRDQVKVGDVGFFDWNDNDTPDHVMLVSSVTVVDGVTKIAFVSHNLDGDYRDLDNVITVEHPGGNAWFWSIPA